MSTGSYVYGICLAKPIRLSVFKDLRIPSSFLGIAQWLERPTGVQKVAGSTSIFILSLPNCNLPSIECHF